MQDIGTYRNGGNALPKGWWGVIAVAVAVVYFPSLHHAFQYDDVHSIVENYHVRSLANIDDFFWRADMFTADPKGAMYRPLVLVSYAVNYALGGYNVEGYRCFNIAVHLLNGLLVCHLLHRLTGVAAAGLAAGLLFSLHPIAGEPVNYISSRSESLAALFSLLSMALYIRARESASSMVYIASVVVFATALLAKSMAIVLPLVLLFRDCSTGGLSLQRIKASGKYIVPFGLVATVYVIVVRQALATALVDRPVRGLWVQILTQCKVLVYYLKLLLVPWGQNVEHQFALAKGWELSVLCALGLLVSMGWCLMLLWRRSPRLFFNFTWPIVFLLPTFVVPLNVLLNEHRLYIPAVSFAMLLGWLLTTRFSRWQGLFLLAGLLLSYGALSLQRSLVWQTPETLWADALQKAPRMPRPHLFIGDVYKGQGRTEEALAAYQRALTVNPEILSGGDLLAIYNNTGAAYLSLGRNEEAIGWYRKALTIDPDYSKAREALEGLTAIASWAWDEQAENIFKRAMKLLVTGRLDQALVELHRALSWQPHPKIYQAIGLAYERSGQIEAAIENYKTALALSDLPAGLEQGFRSKLAELKGERGHGE